MAGPPPGVRTLRWTAAIYVSLALHLCEEALHSGEGFLHSLQRFWGLKGLFWGRAVINASFTGVETEESFRREVKEFGLLAKHFWELSSLPDVEDSVHFFVCKTLYEWILINVCFNTWSPFRLSCAMNFPGVGSSKLFHNGSNLEREHKTWKLRRGLLPCRCFSPAFTDVAWEPLRAFCHLFN